MTLVLVPLTLTLALTLTLPITPNPIRGTVTLVLVPRPEPRALATSSTYLKGPELSHALSQATEPQLSHLCVPFSSSSSSSQCYVYC